MILDSTQRDTTDEEGDLEPIMTPLSLSLETRSTTSSAKKWKQDVSKIPTASRSPLPVVRKADDRSDGESECPWRADASNWVEERGAWPHEYRYREMVWESRDGCWRGRWRWSPWAHKSSLQPYSEGHREHPRQRWYATGLPQETLLIMVQCVADAALCTKHHDQRSLTTRSRWPMPASGMTDLALVCRVWYKLIAPALFYSVKLSDAFDSSSLRPSTMQHVRRITVKGTFLLSTHAALPRRYPCLRSNLKRLPYCRPQGRGDALDIAPYHPSHVPIFSQLHRAFGNVLRLELEDCRFLSSLDLLRLLSAFPALVRADLWKISVAHVSSSAFTPPGNRPSRLRRIHVYFPGCVPFVVRCLTWPHKPPQLQVPQFLGLLPAEQLLVTRINELVTEGPSQYHLDAMDSNGKTWVVWSQTSAYTHSLHLEFHASQGNAQDSRAAHIRHCLVRLENKHATRALRNVLSTLTDNLASFQHLKTITIETAQLNIGAYHMPSNSPITDPHDVYSLVDVLRKTSLAEVHFRTCDAAHAITLKAKRNRLSTTDASSELLSPFWCLEEHANRHGWLSDEYWRTLSPDDKRGWDPCLLPAQA